MENLYSINGSMVLVSFEDGLVKINIPIELINYFSIDADFKLKKLVKWIKINYLSLFKKELKITDASLISEIYWHMYASKLAKKVKKLIKTRFTDRILSFIIHRSDTIDCGESGIDSNRWLWDLLSKFRPS